MKVREWVILGFLFMFLNSFLIFEDSGFERACRYKHLQGLEPLKTIGDLVCVINAEIFDPFIWTTMGIWFICWIMAIFTWFENRLEQKADTRRKLVDVLIETSHADERGYILKTAEEMGIKEVPHDFQELIFYAKKIGKEKEAKNALDKWSKKHAEWLVEEVPKKLRKWEKM